MTTRGYFMTGHKEKCEHGSTNVYEDLGFKNADEMQAKASLASRIVDIVEKKKWTQQKAAEKLDLTQPKISLLFRGQLSGFSLGKLIKLLNKLNQDVEIIVKRRTESKDKRSNVGHVHVQYV